MKALISAVTSICRHGFGWVRLALLGIAALFAHSAQADGNWIDISSALVSRLTNNGAKAPWPGGCSGVVVKILA